MGMSRNPKEAEIVGKGMYCFCFSYEVTDINIKEQRKESQIGKSWSKLFSEREYQAQLFHLSPGKDNGCVGLYVHEAWKHNVLNLVHFYSVQKILDLTRLVKF